MVAHGRMPTLAQMRFAASLGLQYLCQCHWQHRAEALRQYREQQQQQQQQQQQRQKHSDTAPASQSGTRRQRTEAEEAAAAADAGQTRPPQAAVPATAKAGATAPMLSLAELMSRVNAM